MSASYVPPQAYDQELADAFRVRYHLADRPSIRRPGLMTTTGADTLSNWRVLPHGHTAQQYMYPGFRSAGPIGDHIPQPPLPHTHHTSPVLSYSSFYEPFRFSHQPPAFHPYPIPSYAGPPSSWPCSYSGATKASSAWQPTHAPNSPHPLYQPTPMRPSSDTAMLRSPSSASLSSSASSAESPTPEPILTSEEFLQELQRLGIEGRGGQAPLARYRVQGESAFISVSRPDQDGPFILRHHSPDGREDAISVAHILPNQSGIVWYPPPRVWFSGSNI